MCVLTVKASGNLNNGKMETVNFSPLFVTYSIERELRPLASLLEE